MLYKPKKHGFTIVEMLVAISIALLMMIIIGVVYQKTGNAVSRGIGLSNIISNNRGINGILARDGNTLKGPTDKEKGGFLVITNHAILAQMPGAATGTAKSNHPITGTNFENIPQPGWKEDTKHPSTHLEWIRDDQIVFVREASFYNPQKNTNFTALPLMLMNSKIYHLAVKDNPIIVWYGHGVRTNKYGNFKDQPSDYWKLGVDSEGRNSLASQWIFARQAMFLTNDNTKRDNLPSYAPYSNGPLPADELSKDWSDAPVNNAKNYMGTSDVMYFAYSDKNSNAATDSSKTVVGNSDTSGGVSPLLDAQYDGADYKDAAVKFLYAGVNRLRVNITPHYDKNNIYYDYNRWQTAQMHSALAVNVSDIEIAFAADITQNSSDDGQPGQAINPDGKLDRVNQDIEDDNGNVVLPSGSIKWYVAPGYQNNPNDKYNSNHGAGFKLNQPVTFAIPSGGSYLPLVDTGGNLFSGHVGETYDRNTFVWRHDAGSDDTGYDPKNPTRTYPDASNNFWPYLIRIRYRMHDSGGKVVSGYHRQGMWFEHIIRVNRKNS